ncbi:MAG: MoxR family ATPase, partial [Bacteroidetes bacterium]|nr:MoxR family ATPase [Bacteroidota bacterium]
KCVSLFYQLRGLGLERAPATRELLNWLKYLNSFDLEGALAKIEAKEGMGVLVKTQKDIERIKGKI